MKVNISKYYKTQGRRVNITIDYHDTYSMDYTLALIILPMLIQLKNSKHGIPSNFVNEPSSSGQECFDFYKDDNVEFQEGQKKWDETLDKMIWSFQQLVEDDFDSKYHHGKTEFDFEKTVNGMSQLVDKNPNGHWYDVEGHNLHNERIQEGLELFGKYYRSLWD
jgi:hypothetical protein